MTDTAPVWEQFLYDAGAPAEVFPSSCWDTSSSGDPVPLDILDQFDTIPLPSKAGACAAHTLAIWSDFQHINQDWILLNHQPDDVTTTQPQAYQLKTPAKKFADLSSASRGVGALTIIHWVATASDGGEPQFTSPVAIVLGPLINSPQLGDDVGYDLSELGLDFNVPAVPLGKTWPAGTPICGWQMTPPNASP